MSLQTEYRHHAIRYDETTDQWCCTELGLAAATLTALRYSIDSAEAHRREIHCRAFLMHRSQLSVTPVVVLQIDDDGASAWVTVETESREPSRERVDLHRLIADTPESRQALLTWREASRLWHEAGMTIVKMADALPRLSLPAASERSKSGRRTAQPPSR